MKLQVCKQAYIRLPRISTKKVVKVSKPEGRVGGKSVASDNE